MSDDNLNAEIDLAILMSDALPPTTYKEKREAARQRKLERKNTRETQNYLAAKKREARLQWSANNPGSPFPRKLVQQAKHQEIALLNDEAPSDRAI